MTKSRELGIEGEQKAADYLESIGYRIIDRNWRCRDGEIDLVAVEGVGSKAVVAVVEVKTRTGHGAGHPFEAVTPDKVARLRRLATAWALEHPGLRHRLRIDVVGVTVRPARGAVGGSADGSAGRWRGSASAATERSLTVEHLRGVGE